MTHLEIWVRTPLGQTAGWALFHSLWEGAIVAAVLAATLAVIRDARTRYAAACLAMATIVVGFGATFLQLVPQQQAPGTVPNPGVLAWKSPVDGAALPQTPRSVADFLPWLAPFWMAGVILFYLRHLANWAAAQRLRRTGVCCAPDFWQDRLSLLAGRVRLSRPVALLESCLAGVPVVIGHLRPVILMPVGLLAGLPAGQIESILLHELAHIRRFDYLVNMLQTSVEGLLFYHPAVWWISGVIRTEREHCCDDLAVALSGDAHEYAVALTALEHNRRHASEAALAATGGSLVKRIRRLLIASEGPSSAGTPLVSAVILTVTAAVGLTAWQTKAPASPAPTPKPQGTLIAQAQPSPNPAQEVSPYTKWLEEDVVYIITPEERAAFLRLQTDQEREHFIEQFWLRRDPTPGTPENEAREEHYRRIEYANLHFPTAQGTAGWRTDRGRIYIEFGPPDEREEHPNGDAATAFPFERWRYRFIGGIGNNVDMEFVDTTRSGDFRMTLDPNRPPSQNPR